MLPELADLVGARVVYGDCPEAFAKIGHLNDDRFFFERQVTQSVHATATALVVGKAVLVAKLLPFFGRFDNAPLVQPIVFKTFVYWAVVFAARFLEKLIEYLLHGGRIGGIPDYVTEHFTWHRFGAIQIWIFVLFLIYVTADELNTLFGHGELYKIFFTRRSSQLKLTRRQRVRKLVELDRLTEAHGVAQLSDPKTAAHAEMVGLIESLASRRTSRAQTIR